MQHGWLSSSQKNQLSRAARLAHFGLLLGLGIVLKPDAVRGETVATVAPRSGARLLPIHLEGDDGASQFAGWFDTARAEECSYALSGDGSIRCLPTAMAEARLFLDANCLRPIASVSSCIAPQYVVLIEPSASGCATDARHHVYQAGRSIHLSAVYVRDRGECAPVPANPSDIFVEAGASIAPSAFVAGKYVTRGPQLSLKTAYDSASARP